MLRYCKGRGHPVCVAGSGDSKNYSIVYRDARTTVCLVTSQLLWIYSLCVSNGCGLERSRASHHICSCRLSAPTSLLRPIVCAVPRRQPFCSRGWRSTEPLSSPCVFVLSVTPSSAPSRLCPLVCVTPPVDFAFADSDQLSWFSGLRYVWPPSVGPRSASLVLRAVLLLLFWPASFFLRGRILWPRLSVHLCPLRPSRCA